MFINSDFTNIDSDYASDSSESPICSINGFMSHRSMDIWKFLKRKSRIIELNSGGVKSAYDTAIEIFYQLKGGKVDYGLKHANKHNHKRFGNFYDPEYAEWSEENPIHIIAHSLGGCTALLLQKLLDLQVFADRKGKKINTNSRWIKSITTISSPFQGSPIVYSFGYQGEIKPKWWSVGSFIYKISYVWHLLSFDWLKSNVFDFGIDHFISSKWQLLKLLLTNDRFDSGLDNASKDISFDRIDNPLPSFSHTYYKSYACHIKSDMLNPMAYLGNSLKSKSKNDGIVPFESQFHPESCKSGYCCHEKSDIQPGIWNVHEIENCSHFDIVQGKFHEIWEDYLNYIDYIN